MNKIKILAVDDEEKVLKIYKNFFLNHDLITVSSSLKAAQLIKTDCFDIFIVDYQMPDLTGMELLKMIQQEYKDIIYISILATAYGTVYLFKEEFLEQTFHFFIEKPFEVGTLKQVMKMSINRLIRKRNRVKELV